MPTLPSTPATPSRTNPPPSTPSRTTTGARYLGERKGETKQGQGTPRITQLATMVTDDEGGEEDGEEEDPVVQLRPFHHHPPRKSSRRVQPRHSTIQTLLKLLRIYESTGLYLTERSRRYATTKPTASKGDKFRRASSHTERNIKQVVYLLRKTGL